MIQMSVGQQNLIEPFEAQPAVQQLALGALAAIDQESVFIMHHDLGGEAAVYRWR